MKHAFLEHPHKNLKYTHWSGVSISPLASTLIQAYQKKPSYGSTWIVCPRESQAEELLLALQFFAQYFRSNTSVALYPQDDPRTFDGASPAHEKPRQRLHALSLLQKKNTIVVSSIFAALHKTLSTEDLNQQTCLLEVGKSYDNKELQDQLHQMGYLTEYPNEEGLLRFRGDTLHIWPNGSLYPYRISFFDDELESIEALHSQNNTQNFTLPLLRILPCKECILSTKSMHRLTRSLRKCRPEQKKEASRIRQELSQGYWFPAAEDYLPLLWNIQSPVTHVQKVILFDTHLLTEEGRLWDERIRTRWKHLEASEQPLVDPNLRFSLSSDLFDQAHLRVSLLKKEGLHFHIQPPSHYSLSLTELDKAKRQIRKWLKESWEILLVVPSAHQQSKLENLLQDIPYKTIESEKHIKKGFLNFLRGTITQGYIDPTCTRAVLSYNDLLPAPIQQHKKTLKEATLMSASELKIGDYVVHKMHGIGKFLRLSSAKIQNTTVECIEIQYQAEATVLVPLTRLEQLYRYRSISNKEPKIDKLGGKSWAKKMTKVKGKVMEMAHHLIRIHAKRAVSKGFQYNTQSALLKRFSAAFPYEETPDQESSIQDVLKDLTSKLPMDRLLIGDVGFGKTEVAMRAAMCVAAQGHQVALLCPTTILALQHHRNFNQRFEPFGIKVALLSRLQTAGVRKKIIQELQKGSIHIVIGTHALLNKRMHFKKLGLVIADEEHRFGVVQKEKLRALSQEQVDHQAEYLAMSATPIPRTLHMAFSGIRAVSVIATPPPGRKSVETLTLHQSDARIQQQIRRELKRGGQIFFLHNRIESLNSRVEYLKELVPEANICSAHGRQSKNVLEKTMIAFMKNQFNILVCTSIIENGVDLPNANTIIIDQAHQLGLAQLYQLRGRVGRSSIKAYCTFVIPKTGLSRTALARLHTLQRHTDLASGFAVASADLELRGSGNLLGKEQSGHIEVVGLDIYIELLEKAVRSLRKSKDIHVIDPEVEIPVSTSIPSDYIPETQERLQAYQKIASLRSHAELRKLMEEWEKNYGDLPEPTLNLAWSSESMIWCRKFGILKLHWLKTRVLMLLHPNHALDEDKLHALCEKNSTRLKIKNTDRGIELSAYFRSEEKKQPFGFIFWIFQEFRGITR